MCYTIVESDFTWDEAVDKCAEFCDDNGEANLATIICKQEQDFITDSKFLKIELVVSFLLSED